ncbi:MAG: hypothetical protein H0X64_13795 [Gemmatimonadaceae bacterium]|nr:hypothetical protein [Gemmatimonadaceae bacterium]
MALSTAERKHRMPFGAQKAIAAEEGVAESYVSAAVADELRPKTPAARMRLRRIRVAVARKLKMRVDEVFPADAPESERATAVA